MSIPFMSDKHALIAERGKRVQEYEQSRAYWDAWDTDGFTQGRNFGWTEALEWVLAGCPRRGEGE